MAPGAQLSQPPGLVSGVYDIKNTGGDERDNIGPECQQFADNTRTDSLYCGIRGKQNRLAAGIQLSVQKSELLLRSKVGTVAYTAHNDPDAAQTEQIDEKTVPDDGIHVCKGGYSLTHHLQPLVAGKHVAFGNIVQNTYGNAGKKCPGTPDYIKVTIGDRIETPGNETSLHPFAARRRLPLEAEEELPPAPFSQLSPASRIGDPAAFNVSQPGAREYISPR